MGSSRKQQVVAAGHQLGQHQLGLLAARERAGRAEHDVAAQPEHAQQAAQLGVADGGVVAHLLDQRPAGVDQVVLLGVVAGVDLVAVVHRAQVGLGHPGQDPQQRGLARAVEAHDQQALAPLDREGDRVEHVDRPVGAGQVVDLEHGAPGGGRLGEPHVEVAPLGRPLGRGVGQLGHPACRATWPVRARLAVWWRIESASVDRRRISACSRSTCLASCASSRSRAGQVLAVGALVLGQARRCRRCRGARGAGPG